MVENHDFGAMLIDALEEAVEHYEGRLTARVDRVEIIEPASEGPGMLQGINTGLDREEDGP